MSTQAFGNEGVKYTLMILMPTAYIVSGLGFVLVGWSLSAQRYTPVSQDEGFISPEHDDQDMPSSQGKAYNHVTQDESVLSTVHDEHDVHASPEQSFGRSSQNEAEQEPNSHNSPPKATIPDSSEC